MNNIKLLKERLRRYEAVLGYTIEGIEMSDAEGKIIYINKKFSEMTGIKIKDRLNKNIFEMNPDGLLPQVLIDKQPIINAITTAPGMEGQAVASCYPIFNGIDDELIGAVIFGRSYSQEIHLSKRLNEHKLYLKEIYRRTAKYTFSDIKTASKQMESIVALARQMSVSENPVALIGEFGTGKGMLAQAIHSASTKNNKPFIRINCAECTEENLNQELFGNATDLFSKTLPNRMGLLNLTDGGTFYLKNVEYLSQSLQTKLLRKLMNKNVNQKKGLKVPAKIRILISLNSDIKTSFNNGLISEELYNYVKNYCINIPPLRDRKIDIPNLVNHFISKMSKEQGKFVQGISRDALELLKQYKWPGNIMELKVLIQTVTVTSRSKLINAEHVLSRLPLSLHEELNSKPVSLEEIEKNAIRKTLSLFEDSLVGKKEAANALEISLGTLYNKINKYGL